MAFQNKHKRTHCALWPIVAFFLTGAGYAAIFGNEPIEVSPSPATPAPITPAAVPPPRAVIIQGVQPIVAPPPGGSFVESNVVSPTKGETKQSPEELANVTRSTPIDPLTGKPIPQLNNEQIELLKQNVEALSKEPEKLDAYIKALQKEALNNLPEPPIVIAEPAPPPTPTQSQTINDQAFQMLLQNALPLSPEQIKLLHKLYDVSQAASAETPNPPPTPMSSSTLVSLEPGATPPVIRLSAGFVTSLVFADSTGAPWPITSYTLGDPTAFNIQWDQRSNTLFIQSLKLYAHGNLAINLYGSTTPVMLSIVSGQKHVDYRIDFQIAGRGPEAAAPILPAAHPEAKINPILINILDGVPPRGSVKLEVSGNYGEAWLYEGRLYFRTRLVVLSPAWMGTVSSPDGTHVYEMVNTPTILASKDGQTLDIRLTGL